jgi:NhaP-type Na+/H+ or K+/H+ antiporter
VERRVQVNNANLFICVFVAVCLGIASVIGIWGLVAVLTAFALFMLCYG